MSLPPPSYASVTRTSQRIKNQQTPVSAPAPPSQPSPIVPPPPGFEEVIPKQEVKEEEPEPKKQALDMGPRIRTNPFGFYVKKETTLENQAYFLFKRYEELCMKKREAAMSEERKEAAILAKSQRLRRDNKKYGYMSEFVKYLPRERLGIHSVGRGKGGEWGYELSKAYNAHHPMKPKFTNPRMADKGNAQGAQGASGSSNAGTSHSQQKKTEPANIPIPVLRERKKNPTPPPPIEDQPKPKEDREKTPDLFDDTPDDLAPVDDTKKERGGRRNYRRHNDK